MQIAPRFAGVTLSDGCGWVRLWCCECAMLSVVFDERSLPEPLQMFCWVRKRRETDLKRMRFGDLFFDFFSFAFPEFSF